MKHSGQNHANTVEYLTAPVEENAPASEITWPKKTTQMLNRYRKITFISLHLSRFISSSHEHSMWAGVLQWGRSGSAIHHSVPLLSFSPEAIRTFPNCAYRNHATSCFNSGFVSLEFLWIILRNRSEMKYTSGYEQMCSYSSACNDAHLSQPLFYYFYADFYCYANVPVTSHFCSADWDYPEPTVRGSSH